MRLGRIAKYFPIPKYLKPAHIGVSFSDTGIRAVFFDVRAGLSSLKTCLIPLERGSISEGKIVNLPEVTSKLSVVRKNFDRPFVFFTVPDEIAYVFSAEVPVSSGGDMTESVAFIMEENVPLPLSDVIFDFSPLKIVSDAAEDRALTVVAAVERREVEKFLEAFEKAGFEPLGCIHESEAVAKAVVPQKFARYLAVIQAREERVGIHLVKGGVVHFSTLRNISGKDYKAEFLDEYQRFLEYCAKYDQGSGGEVRSAFVCGEFEYAKIAAAALIDSNICQNTKLSNVWTNVFDIDRSLPEIPYEKSLSFAGAVGAALSESAK